MWPDWVIKGMRQRATAFKNPHTGHMWYNTDADQTWRNYQGEAYVH